jgi:hypothetical protein
MYHFSPFVQKLNDQLYKEAELWNKVWDIPARVGKFGGELGLIMPYVFPCTDEELQKKKEVHAAVICAVEKLGIIPNTYPHSSHLFTFLTTNYVAKKCVHHLDVKWSHVGLFHDFQNKLHVCFLVLVLVIIVVISSIVCC